MREFSQIVPDAAAFDMKIRGALSTAVSHAITIATAKARSDHGWKDRTFATRRSLEGVFTTTRNGAEGELKAEGNAARLAYGTKPHRIEAGGAAVAAFGRSAVIGKHALRFQMGGQTIFRRAVNHPGTSPDPYLDAAAEAAAQDLFSIFEAGLDAIL